MMLRLLPHWSAALKSPSWHAFQSSSGIYMNERQRPSHAQGRGVRAETYSGKRRR